MSAPNDTDKLVLVVEDDDATREAFALILSGEGYRVHTAANGEVALEQMRTSERPELVLLDLMMPVMDGFQLRERMKQEKALADIPVIVCSAQGRLRERSTTLNAADYLDKPVDVPALLAAVRRHC
jgi:CheY-like chemotaxis protein